MSHIFTAQDLEYSKHYIYDMNKKENSWKNLAIA